MVFNFLLRLTADGVRLPISQRQRLYPNGTFIVDEVSKETDEGQYSCTAKDRQGRSDSQTLSLRVMGKFL